MDKTQLRHFLERANWLQALPPVISIMATEQRTVDFILEQMGAAGSVSAKKMFGEYGLYLDGKLFALVCDDQLFLKPTTAGRAYAIDLPEGIPYPGAKPCLLVAGDLWDESEWLAELVRITAAALPASAPKKTKRRAVGST